MVTITTSLALIKRGSSVIKPFFGSEKICDKKNFSHVNSRARSQNIPNRKHKLLKLVKNFFKEFFRYFSGFGLVGPSLRKRLNSMPVLNHGQLN